MKRGFKKRCEVRAVEYRKDLGLSYHDALPSQLLSDHLGIPILSPKEIPGLEARFVRQLIIHDPSSWSAATIKVADTTVIVCNSEHSTSRRESNVMHELSHVILDHRPLRFVRVPWFPFPLRQYRTDDEEEAGWLGGCLQIPRRGLLWVLQREMSERQIALHFGASGEMIQFRRNVTGVDRQIQYSAT